MPALVTHYLLGEQVLERIGIAESISSKRHTAFLWGCQGPDPLFFAFRTRKAGKLHALGSKMHVEDTATLLLAVKESLDGFEGEDFDIARGYALGFMCHFITDSFMHPFVYSTQARVQEELDNPDGSYIHALIEASLDVALLDKLEHRTVQQLRLRELMGKDKDVIGVIARLLSDVARRVYGLDIPVHSFVRACYDVLFIQSVLHSKKGRRRKPLAAVERFARRYPYSMADALMPRNEGERSYRYTNREHAPWKNPFTGQMETASFFDLFDAAVARASESGRKLLAGEALDDDFVSLNFHGDHLRFEAEYGG